MFSAAASSATTAPKAIASRALKKAGLIDPDAQMRDVNDQPGGRKSATKHRSHRNRPIDAFKDQPGLGSHRLSSRLSASNSHAGPSDPLAIRGASRPTAAGRLRRNAVSAGGVPSSLVGGPRVTVARPKAVESWREVVRKRWNPELQFLNLDSLLDEPLVQKYDLKAPGIGGGSAKEAAVIFKLASELSPAVKTLSLADNKLTGDHLQHLHKYLPKLVNLNLQNNNLRTWKDVDYLSGKNKLKLIRELILLGNPVREMELKHDRAPRYRTELTRRFSGLVNLDMEAVAKISFDVPTSSTPVPKPSATTFPYEVADSFVTGIDLSFVGQFCAKFFELFDTQRAALAYAYHPGATFSYAVNTTIPSRARIQAFHHSKEFPNQKKLEWAHWIAGGDGGSRNLSRIQSGLEKTVKSLHIGPDAIVKAIQDLPGTRHNMHDRPERFCVDAFPVPTGQGFGLLITLHGDFTEVGPEGVRSFDRSWVLAPSADGSPAKLNGWDAVILSDQWIIRVFSSPEAWKAGPRLVQALPPPPKQTKMVTQPTPPQPQPVESQSLHAQLFESLASEEKTALNMIPEPQRGQVLEVMAKTNLNTKFAFDCLSNNGWVLDAALANFNQVKGGLGREAYI